jgi:anthranilate phosphoribosyltransferase
LIENALQRVESGEHLSAGEISQVIDAMMLGRVAQQRIAAFLLALRAKGETVEEIAGAAASMRRHMTRIAVNSRTDLVDTCGTGGGGLGTLNISTAAALVVAASGVPVAKHGNRAVTSRSGSADVLAELGVNIEADVDRVADCLEQIGICFCFAPLLHGAMRHVAAVRKELGVPTIFNMLGPLTNPAGADFQLIGVGRPALREKLAGALSILGTRRALVVCGEDGLGEVSISGTTHVTEVTRDGLNRFEWTPDDFDLPRAPLESLKVDSPVESAAAIRDVLAAKPGPRRDVVVANAAAVLWMVGKVDTPAAGTLRAAQAIDSGESARLLARLVEVSRA